MFMKKITNHIRVVNVRVPTDAGLHFIEFLLNYVIKINLLYL